MWLFLAPMFSFLVLGSSLTVIKPRRSPFTPVNKVKQERSWYVSTLIQPRLHRWTVQQRKDRRPNIVPIIEDARQPMRYRMLVGMVDVIFSDVAQPDQVPASMCLTKSWQGFFHVEATCCRDLTYCVVKMKTEKRKGEKRRRREKHNMIIKRKMTY